PLIAQVGGRRQRRVVRSLAGPRRAGVVRPFLDDVGDLVAGRDQLEDPAVNLPEAQLLGLECVVSEVADVHPVAEVVEHHAALAAEPPDRPGLPDRLYVLNTQLLAPVPGCRLETQLLGRRACG